VGGKREDKKTCKVKAKQKNLSSKCDYLRERLGVVDGTTGTGEKEGISHGTLRAIQSRTGEVENRRRFHSRKGDESGRSDNFQESRPGGL